MTVVARPLAKTGRGPDAVARAQRHGALGERKLTWARLVRLMPLAGVLAAQALLTGRLLHLGPVSGNEAFAIYSGHQLIHELWHGGGSPFYEGYSSGAPVIYPVLAASADYLGGLVLVRLVSMAFMLIATTLLYLSGRRAFGYWPAVSGAALFAALWTTHYVGSDATHDAMSLALLSAAAYAAVRSAAPAPLAPTGTWLLLVPVLLLAANATSYQTMLFDPVVIGLSALLTRGGWRRSLRRALALTISVAVLLVTGALLAGSSYLKGILATALDRPGRDIGDPHAATQRSVLLHTTSWIGAVLCVAVAGFLIALAFRRDRRDSAVLAILAIAGLLGAIQGIWLRSLTLLAGHEGIGAWFACVAAGGALAGLAELVRSRSAKGLIAGVAVAVAVLVGAADFTRGATFPLGGASGIRRAAALTPYIHPGRQHYLISYYTDVIYYLRQSPGWRQITGQDNIDYPVPGHPGRFLSGRLGFEAAIRNHWFAVVSIPAGQAHGPDAWERMALAQVRMTPGYVLVSRIGGLIYVYRPGRQRAPTSGTRAAQAVS